MFVVFLLENVRIQIDFILMRKGYREIQQMAAKSSLLLNEHVWSIRRRNFIGGATYRNADLIWGFPKDCNTLHVHGLPPSHNPQSKN